MADGCHSKRKQSLFADNSSAPKRPRRASSEDARPSGAVVSSAQQLECQKINPLTQKRYGTGYRTLLKEIDKLPIRQTKARVEILDALRQSNVLIITSGTGSGKTTQIPKYLLFDRAPRLRGSAAKIACTQPRVVAAVESAKRVAEELDVVLGQEVGYKVGQMQKVSTQTVIQYMTDAMLLAEIYGDKKALDRYRAIIIDEAHERNAVSDVLLSILKQQLHVMPDFKLIIMSATLNAGTFVEWFPGAAQVNVEGSPYAVTVRHTKLAVSDYPDAVEQTVVDIVSGNNDGDILVFLPGEDDVNTLRARMERLQQHPMPNLHLDLYTLHGGLAQWEKDRVLASKAQPGNRRVILATNIAETSLTVGGIRHVIDSGMSKVVVYDQKLKCHELRLTTISKASAVQRKGRVGRTSAGTCWRLYTEAHYDSLPDQMPPPITRTKLPRVILGLRKHAPLENIYLRDFLSSPPTQLIDDALDELLTMRCLDQDMKVTDLGRDALKMGCEVDLAVMMVTAVELGVEDEMCKLAAVLSLQRPDLIFTNSVEHAWSGSASQNGDLQVYITAMQLATHEEQPVVDNQRCRQLGLNRWAVQQAHDKYTDFRRRLPQRASDPGRGDRQDLIQTAVFSGFCLQLARHSDGDNYLHVRTGAPSPRQSKRTLSARLPSEGCRSATPIPRVCIVWSNQQAPVQDHHLRPSRHRQAQHQQQSHGL